MYKIMASFDSIPVQLAKDNQKFQYKVVSRGGTAGIFWEAIDWLKNGGIVYQVYKVNPINIELLSDEELELNNYYNHITKMLFFYNISF